MEPDFGGWATKAGLKCSDGRTILQNAFSHMDGAKVPLVWQHDHNNPTNVLGHAELENRPEGVYAKGYFNDTPGGQNARLLVRHGDISSLSIYANNLVEKNRSVLHGNIREVSLVLSGANPGAKIDYVSIQHGDEIVSLDDEAIIYPGEDDLEIRHDEDEGVEDLEHAAQDLTIQEIYDNMSEEEQTVVNYLVGAALEGKPALSQAEDSEGITTDPVSEEGTTMTHTTTRNVFENQGAPSGDTHVVLQHSDVLSIVEDAKKCGSLREAVEQYALAHGIASIDLLFPDAQSIENSPQFNKRRTEWVSNLLGRASHTPFSRVKTIVADITVEEARAKGYVKGNLKRDEFFGLTRRTTSPTTVYKKQKLDRDDVIDITSFDIVTWLKAEMRIMLEEELARAILIGDGRDIGDLDKIKDPIGQADGTGIRSVLNDHELFATTLNVNLDDSNSSYDELVDQVLLGMENYKGTGAPVFYAPLRVINKMLLIKDGMGRRIYPTKAELASALNVSDVVAVDPMNDIPDLLGIVLNPSDYNVGTDRGGEVSMFDDFDIDYNQMKYLMETRMSGALTKIKSALIFKQTAASNVLVADITAPTFVRATGVVTIPTKTGVVYKNQDTSATLTAGAQTALTAGSTLNVVAVPASGYYFGDNAHDQWSFTRPTS